VLWAVLEQGIYTREGEQTDSSGRLRKKWKQMKAKMQGRYSTPFYVQLKEVRTKTRTEASPQRRDPCLGPL
jgi:hypothetical protein